MISYENLEKAHALKKEVQEVDAALEYFRHGISVSAQFPFNPHYVLNVLQTKRIIIKDEFMDTFGIDIDEPITVPMPNIATTPPSIDKEV
jgi:hypothetical protein